MHIYDPLKGCHSHKHSGFTLLEISVVLVIIAIVIAGGLATLTASVRTNQYNATLVTMQAIDTALLNFKAANNRLPCPGQLNLAPTSADYGLEAGADATSTVGVGTGECYAVQPAETTMLVPNATYESVNSNSWPLVAEGAVPTNALKLPDSYMYDAWGNHIRYAVYVPMTAANAFKTNPINGVCSAITVDDSTPSPRTSSAVYALISHGQDAQGAYTLSGSYAPSTTTNANEETNCHANGSGVCNSGTFSPTYVQALPSGTGATTFDDIVTYKERWQMVNSSDPLPPYIYAVDPIYNRVNMYNSSGGYMNSIGESYNGVASTTNYASGTGNGQFNAPYGVAVDGLGNVWVTDTGNKRVQEFCADGTFLNTIGPASSPAVTFGTASPTGIAIDKYNNIWVTDNGNNKVQECTAAGTCTSYGTGTYNGLTMSAPKGIAVDNSTNCNGTFCVWVADTGRSRIVTFNGIHTTNSTDGAAATNITGGINYFGTSGTGNSNVVSPTGIAIDNRNYVWVADTGNGRVDEFTNAGGLPYVVVGGPTLPFGGGSTNYFSLPGTNTASPQALALDASGNVWLTDYNNAVVEAFNPIGNSINSFPLQLMIPTLSAQISSGGTSVSLTTNSASGTIIAGQIVTATGIPTGTTVKTSPTPTQTSFKLTQSTTQTITNGSQIYISNPPQGIAISNR